MDGYVTDLLEHFEVRDKAKTPATTDLFTVNDEAMKLGQADKEVLEIYSPLCGHSKFSPFGLSLSHARNARARNSPLIPTHLVYCSALVFAEPTKPFTSNSPKHIIKPR